MQINDNVCIYNVYEIMFEMIDYKLIDFAFCDIFVFKSSLEKSLFVFCVSFLCPFSTVFEE